MTWGPMGPVHAYIAGTGAAARLDGLARLWSLRRGELKDQKRHVAVQVPRSRRPATHLFSRRAQSMIRKNGSRFPAFAKPASAGEARSEKIRGHQNGRVRSSRPRRNWNRGGAETQPPL